MEVRLTEESKQVLNRLSEALGELAEALKHGQSDTTYIEDQAKALLKDIYIRFTSNTSGGSP